MGVDILIHNAEASFDPLGIINKAKLLWFNFVFRELCLIDEGNDRTTNWMGNYENSTPYGGPNN